jgi:hypothetical protein
LDPLLDLLNTQIHSLVLRLYVAPGGIWLLLLKLWWEGRHLILQGIALLLLLVSLVLIKVRKLLLLWLLKRTLRLLEG